MKHTKILFEHENALEGGYGIESAWALPVEDDNFQLDNILFYAPEYALGDIVKVENRAGELYVIGLVKASGHSTIRILPPRVVFHAFTQCQSTAALVSFRPSARNVSGQFL